jgi:hypothetical protein
MLYRRKGAMCLREARTGQAPSCETANVLLRNRLPVRHSHALPAPPLRGSRPAGPSPPPPTSGRRALERLAQHCKRLQQCPGSQWAVGARRGGGVGVNGRKCR